MSEGLLTETHDDCLDITEPFVYDESIQSLQYFGIHTTNIREL